ncbi:MAG: hypothetical protein HZC24_01290 [Rhodocyclales bacterium]|nr:hypothetical protein [Rhodocyclales bacterium]
MRKAMTSTFGDLAPWQAMLDRCRELFSEMIPGSAVAFVPRSGSGIQPGKHVAGLVGSASEVEMMKWVTDGGGMQASLLRYPGFADAKVDLLFVADDDAIATMQSALGGDTLSAIKRLIRQGSIMFFVLRNKFELQDAGYEEFLDTLGLAFLGACR